MRPAASDKFLFHELQVLTKLFDIDTIIETGTYLGESAKIFAGLCKNVVTIENNESFFTKAQSTLSEYKNVTPYHGDSPSILPGVLKAIDQRNVLFFLDAHWQLKKCPLLDELETIQLYCKNPKVIIIHDFYVPDENGKAKFGYDLANNNKIDYAYVKKRIENVYNKEYTHYCLQDSEVEINAGVGIFHQRI